MSKSITASVAGVQLQVAADLTATPEPVTDPTGTASPLQLSTLNAIVEGGNLGIGTNYLVGTTPSYPLHVAVGKTVRFDLTDANSMVSLGAPGAFNIDAFRVPGGRFTVTNGGNVGINQPNPQFQLDVNGAIRATGLQVTGMQPDSAAPNPESLQAVWIDTNTGTLYYHA